MKSKPNTDLRMSSQKPTSIMRSRDRNVELA